MPLTPPNLDDRSYDELLDAALSRIRTTCPTWTDLSEHDPGRVFMRANIDAWWPLIERGAEAIVITASGCGSTVKEYGDLLADDPQYAEKARRIASLTRDIAEVLEDEDIEAIKSANTANSFALHCPCSLQHGQQLGDRLERLLARLGLNLLRTEDKHL